MTRGEMRCLIARRGDVSDRIVSNAALLEEINEKLYSVGGQSGEPVSGGGDNRQQKKIEGLLAKKEQIEREIESDTAKEILLKDCMARLNERQKRIIRMWDYGGIPEIMGNLGCSERTAYNRLEEALDAMRGE